ncbi:MAG: PAS domain-containing protein [Burkholderiales bacterium]|nr:PAS domain-containing protein [Burkholderiales bacterium]
MPTSSPPSPPDPRAWPTTTGSWFGGPAGTDAAWPEDEASGVTGTHGRWDETPPRAGGGLNSAAAGTISTFFRIYRAFLTARAALGLTLMAVVMGAVIFGTRPSDWTLAVCLVYCAATLIWWGVPSQRQPGPQDKHTLGTRQTLATVGVDLLAFSFLHLLAGTSFNSQALMILPVLMAAVLMRRILALGVAATATLNLLAAAWLQYNQGEGIPTSMLTQAGLTGFGLFALAILASELSGRLAREERSARGSLELARQQAQLNRLVIEQMSEGVLVVDRVGRVRSANPAARRLLAAQGQTAKAPFQLRGVPAWQPIVRAIERAVVNPLLAEDGIVAELHFDDDLQRALRLRIRFTKGQDQAGGEDICVMFIEDVRTLQARLRQDKLAAMGRMSAGIAHEIRNPLAAISQANALLAEDLQSPAQLKLTQMVSDNVTRLKHIVDDILTVAPGVRPPAPVIDALDTVDAICQEWAATHGIQIQMHARDPGLLQLDLSGAKASPSYPHILIRFEPEHLQRILVNLLDNALRYNSGAPGALIVALHWTPHVHPHGLLMLSVLNDGAPITAETERSLFEPFFSTSSRGTGLGLYICRELCERHGAHIDYRQHPLGVRHRNEFFVTLPVEPPTSLASPT